MESKVYTRKDDDRQNIFELQRFLRYISDYYEDIPGVNPDGVFGAETENAVRGFQKRFGLEETGTANSATWEMIYANIINFFSNIIHYLFTHKPCKLQYA